MLRDGGDGVTSDDSSTLLLTTTSNFRPSLNALPTSTNNFELVFSQPTCSSLDHCNRKVPPAQSSSSRSVR